jgi:hypothetical protein
MTLLDMRTFYSVNERPCQALRNGVHALAYEQKFRSTATPESSSSILLPRLLHIE